MFNRSPTPTPAPPGFVHVDLDGLWTLAGCYGFDEGDTWERDPVFAFALPRMLDLFDRLEIRATFFIVGRDLDHPDKRRLIGEIAERGHELANHTRSHRFGLELLPEADLLEEILSAQEALTQLTGRAPLGFRAPGYDAGPRVLAACAAAGLKYDGSALPTHWGPLLRFMAGRLRTKVRDEVFDEFESDYGTPTEPGAGGEGMEPLSAEILRGQYGSGAWGSGARGALAPQWANVDMGSEADSGGDAADAEPKTTPLLRLPLATSPFFRLPLHASMGMILGASSVKSGLARLAALGWPVTYLIHGLDTADPHEFTSRLPAALGKSRYFGFALENRMNFLTDVLEEFKTITRHETTEDYIERLENS